MKKIGSLRMENGKPLIDREWYRQGLVFKDFEAYKNRPDDPCYVPELSDAIYTANEILDVCHGQKDLADIMFEQLDWQHPESLLEDWVINGAVTICEKCGFISEAWDHAIETCAQCGEPLE